MNVNDQLASREPIIQADLGTNGGKVSFYSVEEASLWIKREIERWEHRLSTPPDNPDSKILEQLKIVERQMRLPRKIKEELDNVRSAALDEQIAGIQEISELFGRYANYLSLNSKSESGATIVEVLSSDKSKFYYLAIGGLLGMLRVPMEDIVEAMRNTALFNPNTENEILLGYTIWPTMDFLGKRDVREQMDHLEAVIRRARETVEDIVKRDTKINEEAAAELEGHRSKWNEFLETAERERKGLEEAFKEHVRLDAPATYWRNRATIASKKANWALAAFMGGGVAVVGLSIVFGPELLERLAAVEGAGSFAPLALVSIPALTALWGLRHAARLFVTNLEGSADARMRETMATTFLALTKEQGNIEKEERLLVLEALFRPAAAARTDDGHFGGALDILTRRNPSA
ncbi:MAG: DUF6161 domain-containing protein [Defluviicoccus sp.]|nr:DUF6161 domain-containing protein [Bryobacterales bacterium]MDE0276284.1 DUF6161 domain-containing protein [Defluviicoccus sp.]